MIGVDIFSGAGGLSVGANMAGIKVVLAVDIDHHALATFRHNHPHTHHIETDIREYSLTKLFRRDEPLILFGGPPCQGFSVSNQRTRTTSNDANWLFLEFIRVANEFHPEWILFENVTGILETAGGQFAKQVQEEIEKLGYSTAAGILDASKFGVPQKRARFFIVGRKEGPRPILPESATDVEITVSDAIADLPDLENGATSSWMSYKAEPTSLYASMLRGNLTESANHLVTRNATHILERYRHIPQGGNWESIPEELMSNYKDRTRCHTGIYRRLHPGRPSVVIGNFRKNMLIHPYQDRGLSVREAARLQSFPDWFEFKGSIGFQQQQVGNAVPPLLAKAVFDKIIDLEEDRSSTQHVGNNKDGLAA
ncbi:MAG: DNA cytosine methyltransferase [Magnetococcales bacterium]|nr:DNA cytosine methyltransferase [Magnetococcales bacterium]